LLDAQASLCRTITLIIRRPKGLKDTTDMSLDILGKVAGADRAAITTVLRSIASVSAVELALDSLDVEDQQALEESDLLRGTGVFFAISARGRSSDATQLWIDAMVRVQQHATSGDCDPDRLPPELLDDFKKTELGRFCSQLLGRGTAEGIALLDGGIEEIFESSSEGCLRRMICDVTRPWDQSPNRLYVCRGTAAAGVLRSAIE
jgi:hypothetical protein